MAATLDPASVMSEVERIAESVQFVRSKRLVRFLRFSVSETLAGRGESLSEHLIAAQAYERPSSFDPQLDPIVRSEARRLRSKLKRYYRTDGARDPIIIKYNPGSYAPVFHRRDEGAPLDFLARAGDMGMLIATCDWRNTGIGPIANWPRNLRFLLDICLRSKFPMAIHWGPDLLLFYNDAMAAVLGKTLHPAALGGQSSVGLSAIWKQIGPILLKVLRTGESVEMEDERFTLNRSGYEEECYFTCCYSPIRGEYGEAEGVLAVINETTSGVLAGRRRATLRELSVTALEAQSVEEACRLAVSSVSTNPLDIPLCAIYRMQDPSHLRLEALNGDPSVPSPCPFFVDLESNTSFANAARKVLTGTNPRTFEPEVLNMRAHIAYSVPYTDVANGAQVLLILRLHGRGKSIFGLLVVGINPQRYLDNAYKTFLGLIASHISSSISNAESHEQERRRTASFAEADEAKTEFLGRFSEELRRISVALGSNLGIKNRSTPELDKPKLLETAHTNALVLFKVAHALHLLTSIDQFSRELVCEPLDIAEATAELGNLFKPAIERAGIALKLQCERLREPLYLNLEIWETVVANLLSNALKFTDTGEIGIATRETGPVAEVMVWDTGTGISSEDLAHLFKPFHRGHQKHARSRSGLGIGLALVKELLALHGAIVRVDTQPQRGSTFSITIPIGQIGVPTERVIAPRLHSYPWTIARAYLEEALQWSGRGLGELVETNKATAREIPRTGTGLR